LLLTCLYGVLTGAWIAATTPLLLTILNLHLLTPAFGLMTAVQVHTHVGGWGTRLKQGIDGALPPVEEE
jgi:hypothetical protein